MLLVVYCVEDDCKSQHVQDADCHGNGYYIFMHRFSLIVQQMDDTELVTSVMLATLCHIQTQNIN